MGVFIAVEIPADTGSVELSADKLVLSESYIIPRLTTSMAIPLWPWAPRSPRKNSRRANRSASTDQNHEQMRSHRYLSVVSTAILTCSGEGGISICEMKDMQRMRDTLKRMLSWEKSNQKRCQRSLLTQACHDSAGSTGKVQLSWRLSLP